MKKRLLVISLTLALILAALTPATAFAAKPVTFEAEGTIISITPGDVAPAGESGRYRVIEREITGDLSGGINGPFTLTYKANVELATQAGRFVGTMEAGAYLLRVNGQIQPLEFSRWMEFPTDSGNYVPVMKLTINGHWTSIDGGRGNGDFTAEVYFVPTPEGHVAFIVDSSFTMTGQW